MPKSKNPVMKFGNEIINFRNTLFPTGHPLKKGATEYKIIALLLSVNTEAQVKKKIAKIKGTLATFPDEISQQNYIEKLYKFLQKKKLQRLTGHSLGQHMIPAVVTPTTAQPAATVVSTRTTDTLISLMAEAEKELTLLIREEEYEQECINVIEGIKIDKTYTKVSIWDIVKAYGYPTFNFLNTYGSLQSLGAAAVYTTATKVGLPYIGGDMWMKQPTSISCVLWWMPIPHVDSIEVARSGKILKFRSTGSVFTAHQEGGEDAIKISGYLHRGEVLYLLYFLFLFTYSSGGVKEQKDIEKEMSTVYEQIEGGKSTLTNTGEFRRTFPFVNKHFIITNCYLESLIFEKKLRDGKDVIRYYFLLRTYEYNPEIILTSSGPASIGGARTNTRRVLEYAENVIWRTINALGLISDERDWYIEDSTSLDVDYAIDAVTQGKISSMNINRYLL